MIVSRTYFQQHMPHLFHTLAFEKEMPTISIQSAAHCANRFTLHSSSGIWEAQIPNFLSIKALFTQISII